MINPILKALMPQNNMLGRLAEIKQAVSGQNPEVLFGQMMQSNPAFASFVEANKGKSPEQIAQENGIDPALLRQLFR